MKKLCLNCRRGYYLKKELQDKEFNRDAVKVYGYKRFLKSLKYSLEGLVYAYRYEQSFWVHAFFTVLAVLLGIIFNKVFKQ